MNTFFMEEKFSLREDIKISQCLSLDHGKGDKLSAKNIIYLDVIFFRISIH
ncbi:MAG: hypothetical protein V6004_01915 [Candidatus Dasytiphilus stammeri]